MTSTGIPQIVVIDDDDSVSDPIAMLIEQHGWKAIAYKSCEAFLTDLDTHDPPDCLILDLHFPSMSGVDLQLSLKRQGKLIPTIILTARPDGPLAMPALQAGALEIVTKPVEGDQLLEKIDAVLAGRAVEQTSPA